MIFTEIFDVLKKPIVMLITVITIMMVTSVVMIYGYGVIKPEPSQQNVQGK